MKLLYIICYLIKNIEIEMKKAASELDFERAMELRDMIEEIKDGK